MKLLANFLKYRNIKRKAVLDSDTVFYIFNKIIEVKYGQVGRNNIRTSFYKEGDIFVEIKNSNWANEIWLNRKMLVDEINKKIGEDEIREIKIKY